MHETPQSRQFLVRLAVPLLLLPCLAGCPERFGTLSGQVSYNGKPLPGGVITFVPTEPGRSPMSARIDEKGHYEAKVPTGEMQIAVDNRELQSSGKPPALSPPPGAKIPEAKSSAPAGSSPSAYERPPGKYVEIPEKYYRADFSDLKVTVTGNDQTHNIELK